MPPLDTKTFVFIAPRYHTHRRGLVQGLQRAGHSIKFFVTEKHSSENYRELTPQILQTSRLQIFWRKFISLFYRRLDAALIFAAPSIREARTIVRENRQATFIIRDLLTIRSLTYLILCRAYGSSAVIYSLGPIYRRSVSWKHKLAYALTFDILRAKWVSPVLYRANEAPLKNLTAFAPISFVPFALDVAPLSSRTDHELRFICVGKFQPRKRLDLLIETFHVLRAHRWSLTVVGDTTTDERRKMFEKLEARIAELHLNDRITLRENVEHDQLLTELGQHDVFILPAIQEPASISQLEAMSRGLAVVIVTDNGTAHYVENGVSGLWIDALPDSLEKAIRIYLESPSLARRHGLAGYQKVRENFSPENAAAALLEAVI